MKTTELVHESGHLIIFFYDGKYYKCSPCTWRNILNAEMRIILKKERKQITFNRRYNMKQKNKAFNMLTIRIPVELDDKLRLEVYETYKLSKNTIVIKAIEDWYKNK